MGLTIPLQLATVFTTSSFSDDDQRFRRQSIRSDISIVAVRGINLCLESGIVSLELDIFPSLNLDIFQV